jgi:hypothetical protein
MLPRSLALAGLVALLLALSASPARAGSGDGPWYGYQTLASDAVSWGLIIGGAKVDVWEISALGLGGVFLGAPVVHVMHDNRGRAAISFGMRAALPLFGLGIGAALDKNNRSMIPAGPIIGALLGSFAASIVDAAVLANEDTPDATPRILSFGGRF